MCIQNCSLEISGLTKTFPWARKPQKMRGGVRNLYCWRPWDLGERRKGFWELPKLRVRQEQKTCGRLKVRRGRQVVDGSGFWAIHSSFNLLWRVPNTLKLESCQRLVVPRSYFSLASCLLCMTGLP